MDQLLTSVTKDVDAYWTTVFKDEGLPEPRVSYQWIPAGQTAASACGDEDGTMGDSAAAYCPSDDTIYISEKFASDVYDGALDHALPGSSQGYGGAPGGFSGARPAPRWRAGRRGSAGPRVTSRSRTSSPPSTAMRSRRSSARSTSSQTRRPWPSSRRPTATPAPGPTAPTRTTSSRTATSRKR